MAGIGGVNCTFVKTEEGGCIPSVLRMRSEVWQIPGLSGYGIFQYGYGDSEFMVTGILYSNDAGIDIWAAAMYAIQGTIVSIVDDHGDTYGSCYLQKVSNVLKRAALAAGGITTRGEIRVMGVKVA